MLTHGAYMYGCWYINGLGLAPWIRPDCTCSVGKHKVGNKHRFWMGIGDVIPSVTPLMFPELVKQASTYRRGILKKSLKLLLHL